MQEMPRTKRDRVVNLTKVKPKHKDAKGEMITTIREAVSSMRYVYVIDVENERNNILKMIRDNIKPARLFMGKNKVMQLALGVDAASEIADGIHKIAPLVSGHRGLVCSDMEPSQLAEILERHRSAEYARTGCLATGDVLLEQGAEALSMFPHSIEPHLRKLGLPTSLQDGRIILLGDYQLCKTGDKLSNEQCQLLKLMTVAMAELKVTALAVYDRTTGEVASL